MMRSIGGSVQANSDENRPEADSQLYFRDSAASSEDIKSVREVLEGFPQAFSVSDFDLGHSRIVEHSVELTDSQPFRDRYRLLRCTMKLGTIWIQ